MDIHSLSPKISVDEYNVRAGPPPPYAASPVVTTTTRTEVVTTTTTETTTHLFSLPYWKKRNGHASPRNSIERRHSATSLSNHFFDKALPPTPPDETSNPPYSATFPSSVSHPEVLLARSRKVSAGQQTAAALAHAALGIGLPHASTSFSRTDTNTIAFMTSPLSPRDLSSPNIRRVKSSQRVQARHVPETQESVPSKPSGERRRRGLSFTASSLLNLSSTDTKGKGREPESSCISPKPSPKPLTRKSSFWFKKKDSHPSESFVKHSQDESFPTLPPLPPVYHISPFKFSDLTAPSTSSVAEKATPTHSPGLPRSHSDDRVLNSTLSLSEIPAKPTSPPRSSHEHFPFPDPHPSTDCPSRRSRTQSNTPLLHRLSMGVFSSGESSPTPNVRSNGYSQPLTNSPSLPHVRKPETSIPKPLREVESPEVYLERLKTAVSKAEVAGILASSADPFYSEALRAYISQFDFLDVPLDVALRKLLMEVGLPRETQQIDRVMEAFAFRYTQCNPNVFISEDHPYILAFSLIMLHTDAFNPSNKRKMTKADYIKNTKLPGIATEVLECFFDNIVFAPFIFIEDPVDFNGQPGLIPDVTRSMTVTASTSVLPISNAVASFKMGNKIDPYYLIINNLLGPLRVDVQTHIPLENPFTFRGTAGSWDEQELHQAFVKANVIEVEMPAMNRVSPIFNINPSGSGTPATELHHPNETWSLKLTKVGVLNRKDDMMEGGVKSSNRRWKAWSAILTGSQLLFFRDPAWASALSPNSDSSVELTPTPSNLFRPDESFSLKDTLAVYDLTYTKYNHTLRFLLPSGRQLLLQAADDKDLNEWISRINYASTFKSVGIKMRPLGLSGEDVHLTGVAAATSHLHDIQRHSDIARPHSWDSNAPHVLMDMLTGQPNSRPTLHRRVTMAGKSMDFEPDVPVTLEFDGAEQFKATFDQVKADLAASWPSSHNEPWFSEQGDDTVNESPPLSPNSFDSKFSRLPSRSHIIQAKIHDLDSKIMASQTQLDSDVRCVRNIAILTPFQKSTRSKLFSAVQGMAKRVALLRLELEKLKCYRTVLLSDLTSEGRTWHRSKQVALRAAKETLQIRRAHTIPAMTLSLLNDPPSSTDSQFPNTPSSQGRKSSISGSFHSAIDFGLDWHSTDDTNFLTTRCESTTRSFSASTPSLQISRHERDGPENLRRSISVTSSANHIRSEPSKVYESDNVSQSDEEQAEEWNRTRCAHRVSLIRVPSDIRMLKKSIGP